MVKALIPGGYSPEAAAYGGLGLADVPDFPAFRQGFPLPAGSGYYSTQDFATPSYRQYGKFYHRGSDWGIPSGVLLLAPADARVEEYNTDPNHWSGYGIYVLLFYGYFRDASGVDWPLYGLFAHLTPASLLVPVGGRVARGQAFARTDNTGFSSGPHLHWETRRGSQRLRSEDLLGTVAEENDMPIVNEDFQRFIASHETEIREWVAMRQELGQDAVKVAMALKPYIKAGEIARPKFNTSNDSASGDEPFDKQARGLAAFLTLMGQITPDEAPGVLDNFVRELRRVLAEAGGGGRTRGPVAPEPEGGQ